MCAAVKYAYQDTSYDCRSVASFLHSYQSYTIIVFSADVTFGSFLTINALHMSSKIATARFKATDTLSNERIHEKDSGQAMLEASLQSFSQNLFGPSISLVYFDSANDDDAPQHMNERTHSATAGAFGMHE
mmetsp:Transcript_18971/g.52698  ORF Transcript_18971/g.52698 Transcript_18971/m.52698 type:complete len:131 (-) Transcript_18971:1180-1572(-)